MFDRNCSQSRQNEFNTNFTAENMNVDVDFDVNQNSFGGMSNNMMDGAMFSGMMQAPIIEPIQERQVHRTFMHEVPHVCPMRTRVINHHVFRHTYQPSYSCCEENTCSTINCGSCNNFR